MYTRPDVFTSKLSQGLKAVRNVVGHDYFWTDMWMPLATNKILALQETAEIVLYTHSLSVGLSNVLSRPLRLCVRSWDLPTDSSETTTRYGWSATTSQFLLLGHYYKPRFGCPFRDTWRYHSLHSSMKEHLILSASLLGSPGPHPKSPI
jgi:hypothetical protein